MTRVLLIHGAAVTEKTWRPLLPFLDGLDVLAPRRPSTGNLDTELEFLTPMAEDSLVVGVSSGATLTLALAASDIQLAGGIAHEPAVGSLSPKLLAPVLTALGTGGVNEFARALYGNEWARPDDLDDEAVRRDIAMFRSFEPEAERPGQGHILVTTGHQSAAIHHSAAAALASRFGYATAPIASARHYVHKQNPAALASVIRAALAGVERTVA